MLDLMNRLRLTECRTLIETDGHVMAISIEKKEAQYKLTFFDPNTIQGIGANLRPTYAGFERYVLVNGLAQIKDYFCPKLAPMPFKGMLYYILIWMKPTFRTLK
jgi:hypothetical protein